ncbi:ran GTPase-activating protein 1 isoform X1 [Monomorium pharaonis]|uniref:ran GTPase-activating protein 1 isoform X1 n=1 Tax=Monomorium pharaonis TaxID=307658 RepID=UPI00063F1359|nr:ran GTPase-activating protein 1 isoform X1 [Monomorium pharaonis]XP_036141374.1 ran GTPase-activating protein 1 isoform X1 [Monomorium pharaonis]
MFSLGEIGEQLKDVSRKSVGVSFAGQSLVLDTANDALQVVEAIKACPCLEYLDLEGNTLGTPAAEIIAEALKEKGTPLKRALWKDMFTGRLKTEIPKALEHLGIALCTAGSQLTELDLSDNAFGPIGIQGLANLLASSPCYTLQQLKLNNNGLGISGGKMLAKALEKCHENSSKEGKPLALKVFIVGRNRLENEGAQALASVFEKLKTLEEVVMQQNGIYHVGITAIAQGLSANPNLRVLNLNDNTIGLKGAKALAKVLPIFRGLEELNLGDCLLKTKGALALAEALEIHGNHTSLRYLDLSCNELRAAAGNAIAKATHDKTLLTNLQLDGNCFGTEGRESLQQILTKLGRLDALNSLEEDYTEDEEEDDDNEDEQSEQESDNEDETSDKDNKEQDNIAQSTVVTVAEFMKSPIGEKLLLLQGDNVQAFIDYAMNLANQSNTIIEQKYIEELLRITMRVSALCGSGYMNVRIKAEFLSDALYAKLFSYAVENDQMSILNNALLVNLGLIKGENKASGKIDWNLEGCFKALEKIIQRDYFLAQTRSMLKVFLEKPMKTSRANVVDPFQDSKAALKAVLDSIQAT